MAARFVPASAFWNRLLALTPTQFSSVMPATAARATARTVPGGGGTPVGASPRARIRYSARPTAMAAMAPEKVTRKLHHAYRNPHRGPYARRR